MTLEQIGGAALMALFLADIFLTILYARAVPGCLRRAGTGWSGRSSTRLGAYAEHRSRWDPLLRRISPALGYAIDEIEGQRGTSPALA